MYSSPQMMVLALAVVFMFSTCQAQQDQTFNNYLDIETPSFFSFNSPLKSQPESLRERPYFDFLSTLYRKDNSKANLFTNPPSLQFLAKREAPTAAPQQHFRQRRAVVFRPLFVYRQQEVRKQQAQERRRRY